MYSAIMFPWQKFETEVSLRGGSWAFYKGAYWEVLQVTRVGQPSLFVLFTCAFKMPTVGQSQSPVYLCVQNQIPLTVGTQGAAVGCSLQPGQHPGLGNHVELIHCCVHFESYHIM